MKNMYVFIICLFLLPLHAGAQRRLQGQKGLEINLGAVDGFKKHALNVGLAFSSYAKNGNRWGFGAGYLHKKIAYRDQSVPIEQFTGECGYYLNFLSDRSKTVFFSAGISAVAGYELVNKDRKLLYDGAELLNKSHFLYGTTFGLEIETYIVDRIILFTGIKGRILAGSSINKAYLLPNIGLRIIIN